VERRVEYLDIMESARIPFQALQRNPKMMRPWATKKAMDTLKAERVIGLIREVNKKSKKHGFGFTFS
jgi:hypothetical protein